MLLIRTLFAYLLLTSLPAQAAVDTYQFSTNEQRERFFNLNFELRCPKCQNQNLADSNAPIAEDLRSEVYRLIIAGKTDEEIKSYLVDRYGEYVLYRPPWSPQTWALWLLPVVGVVAGLTIILLIVRRSRAQPSDDPANLSETEQQQLRELLHDKPDSPRDSTRD